MTFIFFIKSSWSANISRKIRNFSKIMDTSSKNKSFKVFLTRSNFPDSGVNLLKTECDVTCWSENTPIPRDMLLKNICGKDALFCCLTDKIDKQVLDQAGPNLKIISTMSAGYDHIDVEECKNRGIKLGYTPDVLTDATAELTLALLLATNRRLFEANREVYNGGWQAWSPNWMCGQGLKGSIVGLYGFGRIGQEIAKRIIPFKPAQLLYTSRSRKFEEEKTIGATFISFEELLNQSDIIIVCCALNSDTKDKFNAGVFNKMKKNAIFINIARGAIVNQIDLYEALKSKTIQAAGLDVMIKEPIPVNDPLLSLDNIVILPHIGSADINTRIEMSRITAVNILKGLKNEKLIGEI